MRIVVEIETERKHIRVAKYARGEKWKIVNEIKSCEARIE